MKVFRGIIVIVTAALLGITGCSSESSQSSGKKIMLKDQNYYPLKVGSKWTYSIAADGKKEEDISIKYIVVGFSERYDAYLVDRIARAGGFPPLESSKFIEIKNATALVIATRKFGADGFKAESSPRIIIKQPEGSWSQSIEGKVEIVCTLVDLLNVTVQAGTFKDTAKIHCTSIVKEDGKESSREEVDYYFAPNVGLINTETSTTYLGAYKHLESHTSIEELIEYKEGK